MKDLEKGLIALSKSNSLGENPKVLTFDCPKGSLQIVQGKKGRKFVPNNK